ncbi:response regulator [Anaerovorax odorimutans]|uniref:response regulator n=1 Tax=Anaerovorax odorimutans TaxID=109327 RepID=UPI0004182D75|nr:response regulator transcription factor [Anaerovorax odorimutans]
MINVVLADDQILLRESIGYILDNDEDIAVVGMAGDGYEVLELCEKLRPDIILMDIEMPKLDGVKATKIIKEKYKDTKVIILTTFENTDNIIESFVAETDGYIVKNISHKDLVFTVKCVCSGLTVIHESVKQIIINRFKGLSDYKLKYKGVLTEKEIEIVRLIAQGNSNKEIGNTLSYSEGTIKNNVSKILEKLNMSDRMQIAIFAIENGII